MRVCILSTANVAAASPLLPLRPSSGYSHDDDPIEVPHVSTGDLIRAEVAAGTALGLEAQRHSRAGTLVPDSLVFEVLEPVLGGGVTECGSSGGGGGSGGGGFILDGFPRTVTQAQRLQEVSPVDRVVSIVMPEDMLIRKSVARRVRRHR